MRGILKCICIMAFVATAALLVQSAQAAIETTCVFDEATQQLRYSITGGQAGVKYSVEVKMETGCSYLPTPPDTLVGPTDSDTANVSCETPGGTGALRIDICQGAVCFVTYNFRFVCNGSCHVRELGGVPSYSQWSLAAILAILLTAGVVILRRRRVKA